jgi:hypothetical protein
VSDDDVRLAIYERFVEDGQPPSPTDAATADAYRRLADAHTIVLQPETDEIWMAAPLSAVPTDFRVKTPRGEFWGNCVWDGLGVIAMLGVDGTVETHCADCDEAMELRVEGGELAEGDGVAHFAVPAARWWDDIGFT